MARAVLNEEVLAETTEYKEVEGNIYFPPGIGQMELFSGH